MKKKKYYCTENFYFIKHLADIQGGLIPGLMLRGKTLHSFVAQKNTLYKYTSYCINLIPVLSLKKYPYDFLLGIREISDEDTT